MLRLILIHEVFHFVWVRLDNGSRREFARVLRKEIKAGARGELGESAAVRKATLRRKGDSVRAPGAGATTCARAFATQQHGSFRKPGRLNSSWHGMGDHPSRVVPIRISRVLILVFALALTKV